jgi:pyridoxamine 5'-phosphate oxidase
MIDLSNISQELPYQKFVELYDDATKLGQPNIEAISINSFDNIRNEPDARFVNLKFIINNEWIFFSNYLSPKALQFEGCNNISGLFFWHKINTQIRIKAKISKTNLEFSNNYFKNRDKRKNLLAISSNQSKKINSYDSFVSQYKKSVNSISDTQVRPDYWGGYSFTPYYFEFWQGHDQRLNKREVFSFENRIWKQYILQP